MDELTEVQIRLFNALSPVWRAIAMDRICEEIEWKNTLKDILKIENKLSIYNKGTKDEYYFAENVNEGDETRIKKERRKEVM
jgi:hypothetical protein